MSDYPKNIDSRSIADVGAILFLHDFLFKGSQQYGVVRKGNSLRFEACYANHPELGEIRCKLLQERGIPYKYDKLSNWIYVDFDTTEDTIKLIQSRNLDYLHLPDSQ